MAIAARQLEASLSARKARRGAEIAITTSDGLAPILLRALARCDNDTKIRLVITDEERDLEPGTIDIALRPTGAPRRSLRGRRLGTLAVGVYQRKGSQLGDSAWVLPSEDMRKRASLRWLRAPDTAHSALECDRLLAMRDACVAGLGRAALPCYLAIDDARLEQVSALEDGVPLWLFVATASQSERMQRSFVDTLARQLKAEKAAWRK
jgi:DNA-binding transcriptional LysR family regulator